eukprot:TRINITY_DN7097_c0_g1_i2.p1 TRINITY_DN7097_c0_g1~~TRINITY_DN7097_c0_g1_i2.p1  ORF type:complete len:400 (-),score=91.89 TRINITY_DN7097_c0_g1_i2:20-1180(-)
MEVAPSAAAAADPALTQRWRCPSSVIRAGFEGTIGNTPLIRLQKLSEETGCDILGKAEFLNPGGSVKDRTAASIIRDAEERGALKPGGTVVEGTAGNTGIGLAHLCRAKGYKCRIIIPDSQSEEKIALLRLLGAEVTTVPAVPYSNPNNYVRLSERIASELPNAVWANQFDNLANRRAHYATTGPEIWRQTEGHVDAFVAATGTGGTLAGIARYLKEQNKHVRIYLADPKGSSLYGYYKYGRLEERPESSITEGIGSTRISANLADTPIDDAYQISDEATMDMFFRLLHEEGLFLGTTSALNVAAAVEIAKMLGPGHTIVTILCDTAARYQSRIFNLNWLRQKGLTTALPAITQALKQPANGQASDAPRAAAAAAPEAEEKKDPAA